MAAKSSARRRIITTIAATERWNGPDDPRLPALRAKLGAIGGIDLLRRAADALDPFAPAEAAEAGRLAAELDRRIASLPAGGEAA